MSNLSTYPYQTNPTQRVPPLHQMGLLLLGSIPNTNEWLMYALNNELIRLVLFLLTYLICTGLRYLKCVAIISFKVRSVSKNFLWKLLKGLIVAVHNGALSYKITFVKSPYNGREEWRCGVNSCHELPSRNRWIKSARSAFSHFFSCRVYRFQRRLCWCRYFFCHQWLRHYHYYHLRVSWGYF